MTMTLRAGPLPASASLDIERRALQQMRGFLLTAAIQAVNGSVTVTSIRCDGTRGPSTFVVDVWNFPSGFVDAGTTRNFEKPVVIAIDQSASQDVPIVFNCSALGDPISSPVSATITVPGSSVQPVTGTCRSGPETLCLDRGGFQVNVNRRDATGQTVPARVVERSRSDDSGYFWFFNENNIEATVKVLNACAINDRFWVFFAATTDIAVDLTVIETRTGLRRVYSSPGGAIPRPIEDEQAFNCR